MRHIGQQTGRWLSAFVLQAFFNNCMPLDRRDRKQIKYKHYLFKKRLIHSYLRRAKGSFLLVNHEVNPVCYNNHVHIDPHNLVAWFMRWIKTTCFIKFTSLDFSSNLQIEQIAANYRVTHPYIDTVQFWYRCVL